MRRPPEAHRIRQLQRALARFCQTHRSVHHSLLDACRSFLAGSCVVGKRKAALRIVGPLVSAYLVDRADRTGTFCASGFSCPCRGTRGIGDEAHLLNSLTVLGKSEGWIAGVQCSACEECRVQPATNVQRSARVGRCSRPSASKRGP
eukprot:6181886-Pleurochrysis_carterae.AAC.2